LIGGPSGEKVSKKHPSDNRVALAYVGAA